MSSFSPKNKKVIGILAMLSLALIFESLEAPTAGFYILPALAIIGIFFLLPIVIVSVSAAASALGGFFLSMLWSWKLLGYRLPSPGFISHLIIYFSIASFILYVSSKK